jgi:hypothetical protein
MADLSLVRRNIRRMVDGNASDSEISDYLKMEGVTPDALRSAGKPEASAWDAPNRFMRRFNDTLMFGFGDEYTAAAKTLGGNKSYGENLKQSRAELSEAKQNMTLADVIPDTAGMVVSGAATLPMGITKSIMEKLATSPPAREVAKRVAQTIAPQTARQVAGEATRVGGLYGSIAGYGAGEGTGFEQAGSVAAGTAGGAILGRAIPSVAQGVSKYAVAPIANAMRRGRDTFGQGPRHINRMFEDADVPVFGPALAENGTVPVTAKALTRSAVGKPLRDAAQRTNDGIEARMRDSMVDAGGGRSAHDTGDAVQKELRHQLTQRSIPHDAMRAKGQNSSIRSLRELEDIAQVTSDGLPIAPTVARIPSKPVKPVEPVYPSRSDVTTPDVAPDFPPPRIAQPPKATKVDPPESLVRREAMHKAEAERLTKEYNSLNQSYRKEYDDIITRLKANGVDNPDQVKWGSLSNQHRWNVFMRDTLATGKGSKESIERAVRDFDAFNKRYETDGLGNLKGLRTQIERHRAGREAMAKAAADKVRNAESKQASEAFRKADDDARMGTSADRAAAITAAHKKKIAAQESAYSVRAREAETTAAKKTADLEAKAAQTADDATRSTQHKSDRDFQRDIDKGDYSKTFGGTKETYPTEFDAGHTLAQRKFYPPHGKSPKLNLMSEKTQTRKMLGTILSEAKRARTVQTDDINSPEFQAYLAKRIGRESVDALYASSKGGGMSLDGVRQLTTRVREASDAEPGFRKASDAVVKRIQRALRADYHIKLATGNDKGAAQLAHVVDQRYAAFTKELKKPLRKVFGEDVTPEQALDRLLKSAQKEGGDEQLLKSFFRIYQEKGDRKQATVAVLTPMMRDGMESFSKGWGKLSDSAKDVIYAGTTKGLREDHQRLVNIYKTMEPYRTAGGNTGNSIDIGQPSNWIMGATLVSNLPAGIAAVVGSHATARMMASPKFVAWLTKIPSVAQKAKSRTQLIRYLARMQSFISAETGLSGDAGEAVFDAVNPFTKDKVK